MEQTFGSVIGFDDYMSDMEQLIQAEYLTGKDQLFLELVEKSYECSTNCLSCTIKEAYTILNQEIEFLFLVSKEDDILLVVYVGYEESGNQMIS